MKFVLLLLLILLFLFSSWLLFKKYYLFDLVHERIGASISKQVENEILFTFEDIEAHLLSSRAQLKGINLCWFNQTDTVGYFRGDIAVNAAGWINLLFSKSKRINSIALYKADLYYSADHPLIIKSKDGNNGPSLEIANISARGKLLFADNHNVESGQLATNFDIAAAPNYNTKNEFSADQFLKTITNFKVAQLHYYLPDGFYQLMVDDVAFISFSNIVMRQVALNPIHSKKVFAKKKKVATDFIDISVDSIQLIDFDTRVSEGVFIDHVRLYQPIIDVFRDKNFPDNQAYTAILVDLLQELNIPVHLRAADLNEMFIKYSELADGASEAGELFFSDAYARISNITNIEDSLKVSDQMLIEANAMFYDIGKLSTTIKYDLLSNSGQYSVKGRLGSMDMLKVNAIISKLVPVKLESGQVDRLYFNFWGTRSHSEGEMRFKYSDLKLELLEVSDWDNSFTRAVMSGVQNFMLRTSNPGVNGTFRVGKISQARDTTKSMFNYWWITLKSGLLSSVGINKEKEIINYKTGETASFLDKIGLGKN